MSYKSGDIIGTGSKNNSKLESGELVGVGISKPNTAILKNNQGALNSAFIDFLKIENGRLTGFDTAIKQMGYKDAEDFKKYKEENPELFEAMGGVKYEVGTIPEKDSEIKITAINNLISNYKNTDIKEIESIVKKIGSGEWQDAETMNEATDKVNRYVNNYVALESMGYFNYLPEEERKGYVELLKGLKSDVENKNFLYTNFKNIYEYNSFIMNNTADREGGMSAPNIAARIKAYESNKDQIKVIDDEITNMSEDEKWIEEPNPFSGSQMVISTRKKPSEKHQKLLDEKAYLEEQIRLYERYDQKRDERMAVDTMSEDYAQFDYIEYLHQAASERGKKVGNIEKTIVDIETQETNGNIKSPKKDNSNNSVYDPYKAQGEFLEKAISNGMYIDPLTQYLIYRETLEGKYAPPPAIGTAAADGLEGKWEYLTEEEKKYYYYLTSKGKHTQALDFLEVLRNVLYRREESAKAENAKELSGWELGIDNITSIPINIIGGAMGFIDDLDAWSKNAEIDPYSLGHQVQTEAQITRGEIGRRIDEATGDTEFLEISLGDVYQAAMSGIDSAIGTLVFREYYSVIAGMGVASSKAKQLYEQGASEGQIAAASMFAGVAEMVFEKVSIDHFLGEFVNAPANKWSKLLLQTAAQGGIEMSEEMATELANTITDTLVLGSRSEWEKLISSYKQKGYSDTDAVINAMWDKGGDILKEGIMGFISGGMMGGGGSIVNYASNKTINAHNTTLNYGFSQGSVGALIKNGLAMPEGSVAYSQAVKAQAKVQNGKKVSGTALYNLATAIQSEITTKSEVRLAELGVSKSDVKTLAPIVAKAVFGEKLTSKEQSVLNNSEAARQVVKELSADPVNTIWKDAVKGETLQSTANGEGDSVSAVDAIDDGETTGLASGVVQGADGKQYFNDGSGDEYFGDAEGIDVAHGGDTSAQGEAIDRGAFDLSEPTQKDIARAPTSQEAFDEVITGKQKTNIQRHIVDICKQLDSGITVEFVDGLETNGKFVRSQNKILIRSDLSAVQMYVEVFKHEFMHRLETKKLYGKFFDYCFKKSTAFEQYVRAELKSVGVDYNVDTATRVGVIEAYTKYKFDQYKNSKDIPKADRDAFTMENAKEEIVADFFAQILFQGEKYRTRIIEALQNADGEAFIGIGDEVSSEAALLELQQKEPTLFEQVVQWIKDIIYKLRGMPQAKSVADDLEYIEGLLTRVYNSKDSKRIVKKKLNEEKYSLNPEFESQYDSWDRKDPRKIFTIGNTSDALKKIGVADRVITWDSSKIIKIKSTHSEMTDDIIKQVPNILENPIIVMESKNNMSRLTMFGEVYSDNKPILAVLEIEPYGKKGLKLDEIKLASAYGKDNAQRFINTSKVLYVDSNKKRVSNWEQRTRLRLPVGSSVTNSMYSISNSTENVNTEKSNDNSNDISSGQYSLGSPMQQMRYNAEAYAKHINRKYQSKADKDSVAKKIKQIVAQDNKSQKAQEETRQKVYDRKGNLVGELTLKERLINEVAVEIAESIEAPRTAEADEVLSALKERPLVINEKQEAEIRHQFGTLTNFRKDTGIRLVSENSEVAKGLTTLEIAWNGDWVSAYSGYFDADVSDLDMPIRLAEIVDNLNNMTEEMDYEAIATDIAEQLSKNLNETGPKAEKRRVNEAYRRGVSDERAKTQKQLNELQKQNRNLKNRVKPKDVQNIRKEVERIYKKLAANSSTKHVHQGLKKAVSEFLELFNQSDEFTFKPSDRDKVTRLWREYRKLAGADATSEAFGYDAQIEIDIEALEEILPGRSIWELHPDELAQVKDIIANVSHCIETVNEMIVNGKTEEIADLSGKAMVELRRQKGKIVDLGNFDLDMKNTTPVYFFERTGSNVLQKIFADIKRGENIWAQNMLAAREKITEIKKKYGYDKWKDITLKFTTKLGDNIELNLEQAMLLYATVKRENINLNQEAAHTYIGGVVIPTKKLNSLMSEIRGFTKHDGESDASAKKRYDGLVKALRKQIDVAPHQIRVSDFAKISDFLTEQQKAYADEMVAYLSNDMAKLGNEVSIKLFGIEKFNEKYYIPYNSADNFLISMPGVEPTSSIKHRSFTKDLTHGANNPLLLTSFSEVCANHIEQMCMYNAMAIPVDNLTRVLNAQIPGSEGTAPTSVKNEIERTMGKSGLRYINNLIRDMSGSVRISDMDSLVGKVTGRYKKVAVLASLSVVIQQPTSVVRAFRYIPPKYFMKTTLKTAERNYNQMKQYVGEAIIKEMGGFDTGVGASNSDYLLQPKRNVGQFIDDVAGWGANMADQLTWAHIWAASKAMVAKENPELQIGSESFFNKAAEICSETLSKTQVYDSILVKSEAMRSKSALSKMATAFMSEPTVTYNMMMGAMRDVGSHKKGAVKALANTTAVVIGQIIVNAAFKSLVYAMRDDDEDETYFEKWLESFVESAVSDMNFFNYLPYAKDIVSLLQGYSVERMDIAAIADVKQAIEKAFDENATELDRLKSICTAFSLITGVPVKNIWRDAEGAFKTIKGLIEKDCVNTLEGSKRAALVGFAEAVDWIPGIEIDVDGSARLVSELEGNNTYDSLDDSDKEKVEDGVEDYLENKQKFNKGELKSKAKQFEDLYTIRRKYGSNSKKYRTARNKMLDSGISKDDLSLGLEIAKFKYLEQNGITVAEYYAVKTELNRKNGEVKVYDTDGSGGLSTKETKNAINKMKGFGKNEKNILFELLKP